jgi:DNA-binding CsgD family transcriptional regulator
VRTIAAGDALLAPSVTRRMIEWHPHLVQPSTELVTRLARMTEREREVLTLVARGLSNAQIATTLHPGEATARTHIGRVFANAGARDPRRRVCLRVGIGWHRGHCGYLTTPTAVSRSRCRVRVPGPRVGRLTPELLLAGLGYRDLGLEMVASRTFDGRLQLLEYVPTVLTGPPSGGQLT